MYVCVKSPVNAFDCHVLGFHAAFHMSAAAVLCCTTAFPVLSIPMAQGPITQEPWGENRLPFVALGVTGNWRGLLSISLVEPSLELLWELLHFPFLDAEGFCRELPVNWTVGPVTCMYVM